MRLAMLILLAGLCVSPMAYSEEAAPTDQDLSGFDAPIMDAIGAAFAAQICATTAGEEAEFMARRVQGLLDAGTLEFSAGDDGVFRVEANALTDVGVGFFEYRNRSQAGQNYRGSFRRGRFDGVGLLRGRFAEVVTVFDQEAVRRNGLWEFRYAGQFRAGEKQGCGVLETVTPTSNGIDAYYGSFLNDEANGHGVIVYANGDVYTGQVRRGRPEGLGVMRRVAGEQQVGHWLGGRLQREIRRRR